MAKSTHVGSDRTDLGNLALNVLLAVTVKAGNSEIALIPECGWAAYAGMERSSWRHGAALLEARSVILRYDDRIKLQFPFDPTGGVPGGPYDPDQGGFLQVSSRLLDPLFSPAVRRTHLALLTLADFDTGNSRAKLTTISRRCGRTPGGIQSHLSKLARTGIRGSDRKHFERTGRRWRVYTRSEDRTYGRLRFDVLEDYFAFDFGRRGALTGSTNALTGSTRALAGSTEGANRQYAGANRQYERASNTESHISQENHELSPKRTAGWPPPSRTKSRTDFHEPRSRTMLIPEPPKVGSGARECPPDDDSNDSDPTDPPALPYVTLGFVASPVGRGHWLAWRDWHRTH